MNDFHGLVSRHDQYLRSDSAACGFAGSCPFSCGARDGLCADTGQWMSFEKGALIALQGDRQEGLYAVLQGMLTLSKSLEDGRTQIVGLRFAGDIVSARPADEFWQVTLEAAQPTTLCRLSPASLKSHAADGAFQTLLNERALLEVVQAQEHMMTLGRRAPMERLALFLLELERQQQSPRRLGKDLHVPLSRADIGDYLGLKGETISRLFTRLKDAGVITVHTPSRIGLNDRAALEDLAEGRTVDLQPCAKASAFFFAESPGLAATAP